MPIGILRDDILSGSKPTIIPATVYDLAVLARSPIGYWKLEETSAGPVIDSSPSPVNGTNNGATIAQPSLLPSGEGHSYLINSTGAVTVNVPDAAKFGNSGNNPNTGSIVLWCSELSGAISALFAKLTSPGHSGIEIYAIPQSSVAIGGRLWSSGTQNIANSGAAVAGPHLLGMTWAPVVFGTSTAILLYIDGSLSTSTQVSYSPGSSTGTGIIMGNDQLGTGCNARLQKVAWFPQTLSAADVLALWNARNG